jgi:hypothetical protein
MSKMAELDYDIEFRAVEWAMTPKEIADELEIPLDMVLTWFKANGLSVRGYKDYNAEASARLLEVFSPYETSNS